jgi:predicted RNase H-like HicB family nuclease
MSNGIYVPVVITKHDVTYYESTPYMPRPYVAQLVTNPEIRAQGETRDDALERLKYLIKSKILDEEFEIVNMDLNEILVEEVMGS